MALNAFETELSGGHPNSLGNTVAVVEQVMADPSRLGDLIDCYRSADPVVRLRVSSALKRITRERPEWSATRLDDLLGWIAEIDQASTKWTLATIYSWLDSRMTPTQRDTAIAIMKGNLHYDDWIVQNTTSESLAHFASQRPELAAWLVPQLEMLTSSRHKSVAGRARKLLRSLGAPTP